MATYTTTQQGDSNLAVTVTEADDVIALNITPAAVTITSAVQSVNGATGAVTLDTDDISEGSSNLYYTAVRDTAQFNTDLATKDTGDLAEGTNLYYTDTRARASNSGGTGVTYNSSTGEISIGQDVATTSDVTFNTVTATDEFLGDIDGAVATTIRNTSGGTIYKGQAVYVTGLSGDTPTVSLANASNASHMPAVGIVRDTSINNNASGQIITLGNLPGIDASASNQIETGITLAVGDVLYVSATEAGNVTNVQPAGESNLVQNLGTVVRASPNTNMTYSVKGAGRTNATPNLNDGNIFIGNGSNQAVTSTLNTSIVPENTNLYYTDARFDTRLATKTTDNLTEGSSNLYYTNARADARIGAASITDLSDVDTTGVANGNILKYNSTSGNFEPGTDQEDLSNNDTDDLSEGSSNLYYTDARADARIANNILDEDNFASDSATNTASQQSIKAYIASQIATKDNTDEIAEGSSNLYFTNARAQSAIDASHIEGLNYDADGGTY